MVIMKILGVLALGVSSFALIGHIQDKEGKKNIRIASIIISSLITFYVAYTLFII